MERIPLLIQQIDSLTKAVESLKDFIVNEVKELKTEQIADLRKQNERLGDDQRRLWESVRTLESSRAYGEGGLRVVHVALIAGSSLVSSGLALMGSKLFH